jgi:hypothetical protein
MNNELIFRIALAVILIVYAVLRGYYARLHRVPHHLAQPALVPV